MLSALRLSAVLVLVISILLGCSEDESSNKLKFNELSQAPIMIDVVDRDYTSAEPLRPLPAAGALDYSAKKVKLGQRLFNEKLLSSDGSISCATCHDIANGGDDDLRFSTGVRGGAGTINTPTVLNAVFNFSQTWHGKASDLKHQVTLPLTSPIVMGSSWDDAIAALKTEANYEMDFVETFGNKEITPDKIAEAIAAFESSLITPSPFDRYLKGENNAISARAEKGYQLFKEYGCSSCHQGINVGGNVYQKFSALERIVENLEMSEDGQYVFMDNQTDPTVFKVPSLRNSALTAPYFHNGSVNDLEGAIWIMGTVTLGRSLSDEDTSSIAEFLHSLTGQATLFEQLELSSVEQP